VKLFREQQTKQDPESKKQKPNILNIGFQMKK
jgi:hypothetical protein